MVDVISPCVTFNDHAGSTKSYKYVREHNVPLQSIGFVPHFDEIQINEVAPGAEYEVELHDGSTMLLKKLEEDYDPTSRIGALDRIHLAGKEGQVLTGLLYVNTDEPSFSELLNLDDTPLANIGQDRLRPPKSALDEVMAELA